MTQSVTSFASGTADRPYDDVDLSSRAFWSATMDEREESFALLRGRGTITWHPPFENQLLDVPEDNPAIREKFAGLGLEAGSGTPQSLAATIQSETARWADVIQKKNIKPE